MESAVIKRGIIQAFSPANWTATVQVLPSQGNYLGVQVAKHLLAAEIAVGDECAILFFNELNPADALVIAVYSVPSAAPVPPLTSLAGGVGGAALTGDVQLVPGSSGSVSISESGQQIIIDASGGGSGSPPQVNTNSSTVTISDTSAHTLNTLNVTLGASTTVLLVATILFQYSIANAGLFAVVALDGSYIGPLTTGSTSGTFLVNQAGIAQQFSLAFWATIPAGSHSVTLQVVEAVTTGTATISWSQLAMKA